MTPIQEYYAYTNNARNTSDVSNRDLYELMLALRNEQYRYLEQRDRYMFAKDVGANVVGSAIWSGLIFVGSKILKP